MAQVPLTQEEIAHILGVSQRTLHNRFDDQPGVRAAYEKGIAKGHAVVKGRLRQQIDSGNVTATIFYLKTQCGWKETDRLEHSGPGGGPIQHEDLSRLRSELTDELESIARRRGAVTVGASGNGSAPAKSNGRNA